MATKLKKDQKNGAAKTTAPNVQGPIQKPVKDEKPAEPVKPTQEEHIQRVDELKAQPLKRQRTIETLHNVTTFNFAICTTIMPQFCRGNMFCDKKLSRKFNFGTQTLKT